ncbi:hypothetical protein DY123_06210 [Apilactobacillus micheneri]|uniref:DUF5776 domain-containing protein n=1 Tax=Apilactobacillus micheneri TaxID=1899430 RepID=UPI001126C751|nr:DUF5776 domain-containing protein [Apilactobacillus micheneri]TPR41465.1 hypothetical protein DY123_06210 [Apilactobacillus micheneri]
MQYNKKQFKKVNDKKLMKKVKKNWVVLSAATLSILGGFAVTGTLNVNSVSANDDNNPSESSNNGKVNNHTVANKSNDHNTVVSNDDSNTNNHSDHNVGLSKKDPTINRTIQHDNGEEQNNNQNNNTLHNGQLSSKTNGNGTGTSSDKSKDTLSKSSDDIKSNADSQPYQKMVNQTSRMVQDALQKQQMSTEEQNQAHNGSVDAWNNIHTNDQQSNINGVQSGTDYYKAGYQGTVDAWNKYNDLNQGKGTQPTKNYSDNDYQPSDGKNTDYNNPASVDSNLNNGAYSTNTDQQHQAVIPEDPSTNNQAHTGNDTLVTKGQKQYSVNNYNQKITFDYNNLTKVDLENSAIHDAYNQGITDFLKYQGTYDAENGRWSGNNRNDAITNLDATSKNSYLQAYRGAQDAISQQFKSDNTFSYNVSGGKFTPTCSVDGPSLQYQYGFDDVVNKINNDKTAFVSNPLQINNAIDTHNQISSSNQNDLNRKSLYYYGDIKNINFLNDINYQDTQLSSANGLEQYVYIYPENQNAANLTFNGQNHVTDFGGLTYSLEPVQKSSLSADQATQMTVKNFHTIYGSDYWGSMKLEGTGTLNYSNVTYVGAEFVNAKSAQVNIDGNLNVFSVGNYNSPWAGNNIPTEGNNGIGYNGSSKIFGDNQQNMEIGRMTIHSGGNYYGSTTGGNAVELWGGSLNLENGAHMKLAPMSNANVHPENDPDWFGNAAIGLYLEANNANVNITRGASVVVDPTTNNKSIGLAEGIYLAAGNVTVDGGELDVNDNGPLTTRYDYANYINGSVLVDHNGWFRIYGTSLNDSQRANNNLVKIDGKLTITDEGNLALRTDGTGKNNFYLIDNAKDFHVDNPGEKVQLQIDNLNGHSGNGNLFTHPITAYSTKYALGYKNGTTDNTPNDPELIPYKEVIVPSGKGKISYVTLDGKSHTSNDSAYGAKYLSFNANPLADFNGNIDDKDQTDGTNKLTGSIILKNLPHEAGLGDNGQIAINVQVDDGNNVTATPDNIILNSKGHQTLMKYVKDNKADSNGYLINIPNSAKNGDIINFTYDVSQTPKQSVTVTTDYFNGIRAQRLSKDGIQNGSNNGTSSTINYPDKPDSSDALNPAIPNPLTPEDAINDGSRDGMNQASKGLTNEDTSPNNKTYEKYYKASDKLAKNYKDNYDESYNGYNNGYKDINSGTYDPSKNSAQSSSYQNSYNQVINDYHKGFVNQVNGTAIGSSSNKAYQNGVSAAKGAQNTVNGTYVNDGNTAEKMGHDAFNQGFNSQISNINDETVNEQYNPAYNYGAEVAQGIQDASKNNPTYSHMPQDNNGSNYAGYQNGVDAEKGIIDSLNNQPENTQGSSAYKIAYEASNKGINNTSVGQDNALQKYANDTGNAVYHGITDAQNNGTTDYSHNNLQKSIYDQTKQDFNAGEGKSEVDANVNKSDMDYQSGQAAKQGIQDGASGNDSESKYANPSLQRTAYDNAKKAFNAGLDGKKDSEEAKSDNFANQAGLDTKQGMQDALAGIPEDSKYSNNDNYKNAYQATKDGFNGQIPKSGTVDQAERKVYNAGSDAQLGVQAAYEDLVNGKGHNDQTSSYKDNLPTDPVAQKLYNEAYTAYKNGNDNSNSDNPAAPETSENINNEQGLAYQAGQTFQATRDGIIDARNGNDAHADDYRNDPDRSAYNSSKASYQAGYNQQSDVSSITNDKGISYNLGRATQAAVEDAATGKYSDDPESGSKLPKNDPNSSYSLNNQALPWTNPQKREYDNAYRSYIDGKTDKQASIQIAANAEKINQATQDGINAAASNKLIKPKNSYNGDSTDPTDPTKPANQQKAAYDNAYASYNAGYQDNDGYVSTAQANNQGDAYNQGRAAKAAVKDVQNGMTQISDAQNNPDSAYNNDYHPGTIWNNAQKQAYSDAMQAYQDGTKNSSSDATQTPDTTQNQAYQDGQKDTVVKQAIKDAINGNHNAPANNGEAYNDAGSNYMGGFNNPKQTSDDMATKAGQTAYNAIKDATSNVDNSKNYSGEQQSAYKQAQSDYQDGLKGTPNNDENPTYSTAYQAGQAANQAITDATNGGNTTYVDPSLQKSAYDNAKKAYQAGLNGNATKDDQNSAQLNPTANEAGKNAHAGITDAISGNRATNQDSNYVNAYQNANDGLNGKTTHGESTNNVAYQAGQAYNTGINDDKNGNSSTAEDSNNPNKDVAKYNSSQKQAYDQAKQDYSDGIAGNTSDSTGNNVNNNSKGYQQGVNANATNDATNDAINDASNGNQSTAEDTNNPDKNVNKYSPSQKQAYDQAKTDYQNGYDAPTNSPSDGKPSAYQAGQAAKQGIIDAQAGKTSNNPYINPVQQNAYSKAQNDYANGSNDYNGLPSNKGAAYQTGQSDGKGIHAALEGQKDPGGNSSKAYTATKDGMNSSSENENDKSQQSAYDIGKATKKAIDDSNNGDNKANGETVYPGQPDKASVYNRAKNDYNAGLSGNDGPDKIDHSSIAYKSGQAAKQGIQDATNGKHQAPTDNDFDKSAYNNAQSAYQAGLDGNSTKNDQDNAKLNPTANNAGINTKQGIDDAISGHQNNDKYNPASSKYSPDYHNAYDNAQDGNKGSATHGEDTNHDIAYQGGQAAKQGMNDAQTGQNHASDYNNNPAAQDAYNKAKQSYNDGFNGNTDSDAAKANPESNKAGQAAKDGINDAIHNNSNSAHKYSGDTNASNAYKKAHDAYNAGENGDTTSPAAKGNAEANETGQATHDGINDAEKGNNDSANKYAGNSTASNAYKKAQKAYNSGLNGDTTSSNATDSPDANEAGAATHDGINDAKNGNSNSAHKYAGNSDASNAYKKAQDAYNAGKNGDNNSAAAKANAAANNAGYNDYTNAANQASNQQDNNQGGNTFINGGSGGSNNSTSYNNGYNDAQKGFNDGMNNQPNNDPDNDNYNKGYQAAKDYQKGESDASHNQPRATNGSYSYNNGYDAYESGSNDKPYNDNNMNNDYKNAYKQAYNDGHNSYMKAHKANKHIKRNSLKAEKNAHLRAIELRHAAHAGYKRGTELSSPAKMRGFSKAYKRAYMRAYIRSLKINIPRYVYNLKKIYRHSKPTLTRKTRNAEYKKLSLRNRHTFRVHGYGFTPNGHLIFRVKGGWISADHSSIADLYYRRSEKKHDQKVRVIRDHGTYIYNSKHFSHKSEVKYLHTGNIIHIKELQKSGHITRFYLGNGRYLSSNKKIVHRVN